MLVKIDHTMTARAKHYTLKLIAAVSMAHMELQAGLQTALGWYGQRHVGKCQ